MMSNTIYSIVRKPDKKAIEDSVNQIVADVQKYVPGYSLRVPPIIDGNMVTVIVQVEGLEISYLNIRVIWILLMQRRSRLRKKWLSE